MDHHSGALLFALPLGLLLAGAPSQRFVWLEAGRLDGDKPGEVLAALFGAAALDPNP
jgi:hypothetical protein